MKRLITERELEGLAQGGTFRVTSDVILTPSARDYASRHGIQLAYGESGSARASHPADTAMDRAIREIVTAELGHADASIMRAVKSAVGDNPKHDSPASRALQAAVSRKDETNRAVLAAMGENRRGILATLTQAISETGCDIEDVSQTIVGGYFTMILIVDLGPLDVGSTFDTFRTRVLDAVRNLGLEGMLMHEDVLRAMHRV